MYLKNGEYMSKKLTARQQEILDLIKQAIIDTGFPPTRAEIANQLGFKSANAAEEHLKALARKGAIEITAGTSRGIRVINNEKSGLPIIGRVAAGEPILALEHINNYCPLPSDFFNPNADYLLEVYGDSMVKVGIMDGDLIAVHKTNIARNGQIIVARIDNDVTVKRYQKNAKSITLIAENDDYSPIEVDPSQQEFNIEGLYVGSIRKH
jgi:repressor LexA